MLNRLGLSFTAGILLGSAMTELTTKLGGPLIKIDTPIWYDVLIILVGIGMVVYAIWND